MLNAKEENQMLLLRHEARKHDMIQDLAYPLFNAPAYRSRTGFFTEHKRILSQS